jgi:hypothetical protein
MKVTAHIVVGDAAEAAEWYARAFGAQERDRIPLPGERTMSVEVAVGDSVIHVGSEFPDFGILSPLTVGGTATVLQIETDDARTSSTVSCSIRSVIAGTSPSGSAKFRARKSKERRPSRLATETWGQLRCLVGSAATSPTLAEHACISNYFSLYFLKPG